MSIDKLFNFLIFDNDQLIYSKYSFDFINYAKDIGLKTTSKYDIFNHFYEKNESPLDKPTTIKQIYKKYFVQISDSIILYLKKYGILHTLRLNYVNIDSEIEHFEANQFNLYPYSENVCIQDFIYYTTDNKILSKYNFNFDLYATDWKIPILSKNFVFSDFIFRNYKLSKSDHYINTPVYNLINGYVVLPEFVKYFYEIKNDLQKESLYNYLAYQSSSNNSASDKYFLNIDWTKYIEDNIITKTLSFEDAKLHFIENGQFEYRKITFNMPINDSLNNIKSVVGSVYSNNHLNTNIGTGFLFFNGDKNIYFITCYTLIKNTYDQNYIFVIFESNTKNSMAQFKIIGFDESTNIMVSILDSESTFNLNFVPNIVAKTSVLIDNSYDPAFAETLYICSNLELDDNLAIITSTIINSSYTGGFYNDNIDGMIPESLLLQSSINKISSGSPVFSKIDNKWKIVGMVISFFNNLTNTVISIKNTILLNVIIQIIKKWKALIYALDNDQIINESNSIIINGFQRSWLGAISQYNHPVLSKKYHELANLSYIGGLLIKKIIVGYNSKTNEFIYSANNLSDHNIVELISPLIFSKLYKRLIENDNIPIVIKSIYYKNNLKNDFSRSNIGKFGLQESYSNFIYGNQFISLTQTFEENVHNAFTSYYSNIIIDYYYYEGSEWKYDSETIGGNSPEWFVYYNDNMGHTFKQHLFEYPYILKPHYKETSVITYISDIKTSNSFITNTTNSTTTNSTTTNSTTTNGQTNSTTTNSTTTNGQTNSTTTNSTTTNSTTTNSTTTNSLNDLFDPFTKAVLATQSNFELIINRPLRLMSDLFLDGNFFYKGKTIENVIKDLSSNLSNNLSFNNPIFNGIATFNNIPIINSTLEPISDNQIVTVKYVKDLINLLNIDVDKLVLIDDLLEQFDDLLEQFGGQFNLVQILEGKAPINEPNFTGIVTFNNLPITSQYIIPTLDNQFITFKYLTDNLKIIVIDINLKANITDLNLKANTSDLNLKANITDLNLKANINEPNFTGIVRFNNLPLISTYIVPTLDNQFITFKYFTDRLNSLTNIDTTLISDLRELLTQFNGQVDIVQLLSQKVDKNSPIFNETSTFNGQVKFNSTVVGLTKNSVNLSNVDNTSDLTKPISNPVNEALTLKVNISDFNNFINIDLAKFLEEKIKLNNQIFAGVTHFENIPVIDSIEEPTQSNQIVTVKYIDNKIDSLTNLINSKIDTKSNTISLTTMSDSKADKLGGIINFTTLNSPIINTSIIASSNISNSNILNSIISSPTFNGQVNGLKKQMVGLNNVDNTADINKPISFATSNALNMKANIYSPIFEGIVSINDKTESTNKTTGALIVNGGVGIKSNLNVGSNLNIGNKLLVSGDSTLENATINKLNITDGIYFGETKIDQTFINLLQSVSGASNYINQLVEQVDNQEESTQQNQLSTQVDNQEESREIQTQLDTKCDKTFVEDQIKHLTNGIEVAFVEFNDLKANKLNPIFEGTIKTNHILTTDLNILNNTNITNIKQLDSSFSIDNLKPIIYKNQLTQKQEIGIGFNEVNQQYPFLTDDNSINYVGIIGILLNEIQELKKTVNELKSKSTI